MMPILRYCLVCLFVLSAATASAQWGVAAYYNLNRYDGPLAFTDVNNNPVGIGRLEMNDAPELALNYWFRMKEYRTEFLPTLYFSRTTFNDDELSADNLVDGYTTIGFAFQTNLYLFDFLGDCDCPTFGKQGPQLQKGFFIHFAPGIEYSRVNIVERGVEQDANWLIAAGLGLDIGLSNLLTLTPQVTYRRYFLDNLLVADGLTAGAEESLNLIQFGLRLGFRFDYEGRR